MNDVFRKRWGKIEESKSHWGENKTRLFASIATCCPNQLLEIVKGLGKDRATYMKKDPIVLLIMIRGMLHNQIKTAQSSMSYVRRYIEMISVGQEAS